MATTQARKETEANGDWMTLGQAAADLGEARQTVLTRIVAGELDGKHEAGRTLVTRKSVARLKIQKASK